MTSATRTVRAILTDLGDLSAEGGGGAGLFVRADLRGGGRLGWGGGTLCGGEGAGEDSLRLLDAGIDGEDAGGATEAVDERREYWEAVALGVVPPLVERR